MMNSPSGTDPVFLLGVGAQKGGTTWLHAYLEHFAHADFGDIKEYHIWDGLRVPTFADFDTRARRVPLRRKLRALRGRLLGHAPDPFFLRRGFQRRPARYFDYFATILKRPGISLTGDITPSYSGLPHATFAEIRDGFAARGIAVKVVFLLRDPVERSLSAIRMYRRDAEITDKVFQGVDMSLPDEAALLSYIATPDARLRTDYAATIWELEAVFPPEDIHIGFYETMFTEAEFARLNRFFGLTPDPAFLQRKFNTTAKSEEGLSEATRAQARAALSDVYDFCLARYPQLAAHWTPPPG